MEDGRVVSVPDNEGTKRRLPSWMLGVAAAKDQVSKSETKKTHSDDNLSGGVGSQTLLPNSKSKPKAGSKRKKEIPPLEQGPLELKSNLLTKCETKRRGRIKVRQEEDEAIGSEVCESSADKKRSNRDGSKVRGCAPRKRQKAQSLKCESSDEIETLSPGEDDGELTMEDLMSIAQEYVTTDEPMEQPRSSHIEYEAERRLPATALPGNELTDSRQFPSAPQSKRPPMHTEIAYVHNSTETLVDERIVANPIGTGDPAQDMLNLFLGPLLKKPPAEKSKIESIKEDMIFACEVNKQKKNNNTTQELVPLKKKKSSLKDKVAMFL